MPTGRVKWFDSKKGFGFIVEDGAESEDIFFHYTDIVQQRYRTLAEGDKVLYQLEQGQKGSRARRVVRC